VLAASPSSWPAARILRSVEALLGQYATACGSPSADNRTWGAPTARTCSGTRRRRAGSSSWRDAAATASVLISDGSTIRRFVDYERPTGRRGDEIYRAHENLWTAAVYVAPEVPNERRKHALVWLADRMGVPWDSLSEFEGSPSTWHEQLLRQELDDLLTESQPLPLVKRGGYVTFAAEVRSQRAASQNRSSSRPGDVARLGVVRPSSKKNVCATSCKTRNRMRRVKAAARSSLSARHPPAGRGSTKIVKPPGRARTRASAPPSSAPSSSVTSTSQQRIQVPG
jgi:hypothetical protein